MGHAQISVPKIGITMSKTACINPWMTKFLKRYFPELLYFYEFFEYYEKSSAYQKEEITQLKLTCSKSAIKTQEKNVKYVKS